MQTQSVHQGLRQCRFWRLTARIPGEKSIGGAAILATTYPASKRWQYGGIGAERHRPVTQSWSHCLVIRPAAALWWNPGDVAVRILDVASFAVDAILGIDHEARARRFFNPLVDTRRAIAIGRAGIDVVLGGLLQVHVGDLEVNRLGLL